MYCVTELVSVSWDYLVDPAVFLASVRQEPRTMLSWLRSSGLSQVGAWSSTIRFSPFSDRACFSLSTSRRCFRRLLSDRSAVVSASSVASAVTRLSTTGSSDLVSSRCRVVENYLFSPLSDRARFCPFCCFRADGVSSPRRCSARLLSCSRRLRRRSRGYRHWV